MSYERKIDNIDQNLISFSKHLEKKKALEIENLMKNDRNILKIMSEDISQRI